MTPVLPKLLTANLSVVDPHGRLYNIIGVRGDPRGDVLLADRGHQLSRSAFPGENYHRAGHTGQLRAATVADMGRCRIGFLKRDASRRRRSVPVPVDLARCEVYGGLS